MYRCEAMLGSTIASTADHLKAKEGHEEREPSWLSQKYETARAANAPHAAAFSHQDSIRDHTRQEISASFAMRVSPSCFLLFISRPV